MKIKRKWNLLIMDMQNAVFSWRFLVSIISGTGICFFTLLFCGDYQSETIHKYVLLHDRAQSFLAYVVGMFPYVLCFHEDIVYGNIRNVIGRIKLRDYVFSKTIAAYLSTILSFTCGKLLFVAIHNLYNPVCLPESFDRLPGSLLYLDFAKDGSYFTYFFLSSLQKSFYCAVLCQIVMLCSIWLRDVSVMFSIPIAIFYVVHFYVNNKIRIECLNFSRVFDGATRIWQSDRMNFVYSFFVMLISGRLLYRMTLWTFQRKIYHE